MAWGRGDVKIDRGFVVTGLPLGPLLVLVGYAAQAQAGTTITDLMLCALVAFPIVVLLVAAAIAAVCRRDAPAGFPWPSAQPLER
jgi:hypothetical protein